MKILITNFLRKANQIRYGVLMTLAFSVSIHAYSQVPVPESFYPENEGTDAPVASTSLVRIFFEQEIVLSSGTLEIRKYSNDEVVVSANEFSPNLMVRQYNGEFRELAVHSLYNIVLEYNTQYYVTISSGFVQSVGGSNYAGFTHKDTWKFTTKSPDNLFTYIHKSPGALVDPSAAFEYTIAVNQHMQTGNTGTLRLVDITDDNTDVQTYNPGDPNITIQNNVVTLTFTVPTEDLHEYVIRWDEGFFENTSGGFLEEVNGDGFYFIVYKAQAPALQYAQESFWPHDEWGTWTQDDDYLNVSMDRPTKRGEGKIRIYNYTTDALVEEIDVVADAEKVNTKEALFITSIDIFPSTIFISGTRYYVTWDEGVFVDLSDDEHPVAALTDKDFWTFTMEGTLPGAPEVISLSPEHNAQIESTNPELVMTFDRTVLLGPAAGSNFISIWKASGELLEYFFANDSRVAGAGTNQITITPNTALDEGYKYYIIIPDAAFKGENDENFSGWDTPDGWSFQVGELLPYIQAFSPAKNSTGILVETPQISITFDRAIQFNPSSSASLLFSRVGYAAAPYLLANKNSDLFTIDGNTLNIELNTLLLYNQMYEMYFPTGMIIDMDGNEFAGFSSSFYKFTTESTVDVTAPTLVGVDPVSSSVLDPVNPVFELTFNELIFNEFGFARIIRYDDDVIVKNISLYQQSAEFSINGNKILFSPNVTLAEGTQFYLQINSGLLIDQNKNAFAGLAKDDYVFTTLEYTPPVITTRWPENNATQVPWYNSIELKFDQNVTYAGGNGKIRLKKYANDGIAISFQSSQVFVSDDYVELDLNGFIYDHDTKYYLEIDDNTFVNGNDQYFVGISDKDTHTFTTGWDMPQVVSVSPDNEAEDVDRNSSILLTFDRDILLDVDALLSPAYHVRLRTQPIGGGAIQNIDMFVENGGISANEKTITITPTIPFDQAITVDVLIASNLVRAYQEEEGEINYTEPFQGGEADGFYRFTIEKLLQDIDFSAIDDVDILTFSSNIVLNATASTGLVVSYEVLSGPANLINDNELEITGTGVVQVKAYQTGNNQYSYAESIQTFVVFDGSKENQTITFESIGTKTFGDNNFALTATSSSGLPVSFSSSNESVATINGNEVTIVGAGETMLTASQGGDATFNEAGSVSHALTVNKAGQAITFPALPVTTLSTGTLPLSASASSHLAISYTSSNTNIATVSGSIVTLIGTGTTTITALQSGNENYNAALSIEQELVVTEKQLQTISFASLPTKTFGDAAFDLSASASSDLPVQFVSSNTSVATINGNLVSIVAAGTTTITATQAGNDSFEAATNVSHNLVVSKANQTITFSLPASINFTTNMLSLEATSSAALAVSFASSNVSIATIDGNTLTCIAPGTVEITASQAGNANYNAASNIVASLTIVDDRQTIALSGSLDFGNVLLGETAIKTITIANTGNAVLEISGLTLPEGFSSSVGATTVNANASITAQITFASTELKTYTGSVIISSNAVSGTNSLTLSGTGVTITGFNEAGQGAGDLDVYPNPGNGIFVVKSRMTLNKSIAVMDVSGKSQHRILKSLDEEHHELDLLDLPQGIYYLKIEEKGSVAVKRIVKLN